MNRPLRVLPPESLRGAETRSTQGADSLRGAIDERKAPTDKTSNEVPSNVIGTAKPGSRASACGDANADPRSARPEVAVRVSVIDGADRLVYVDIRDRRGWKQPLAAEQVASELRRHPSATDGVSPSEPRTVRTLEMERPPAPQHRVDSMAASRMPTPYSLGKASKSASPSLSAQQQRMSAPSRPPTLPAQATLQAPARAR